VVSLLAVITAALSALWLPETQHQRAAALVGRPDPAPDERVVLWWQQRKRQLPGQPRTTQLLQLVIAELAAGAVPEHAFTAVLHATTPQHLREHPPTVDVHVWGDVASIWSAAQQAGFSMATSLQRVHANALVDQEIAREVQSNVAAPKFSIMTMAVLPAAVWTMGTGFGANPLEFLVTTPVGWVCLVLGLALFALAGFTVRRMIVSALR
jgi:tight adherence protein B